jgi:hypothetical protein
MYCILNVLLLGDYYESKQALDNIMERRYGGSLQELLNGVCIRIRYRYI